MTTTTIEIENQTTVAQTVTVVTQTAPPDDGGLAMGVAFLARIKDGKFEHGELLSLVQQCKGKQVVGLLSAVEQRLAYFASKAYTDVVVEAVFQALPQALRVRGAPDDVPIIKKKPAPPVKRIEFTKDATGAISGAVMRTGS